MTPPLTVAFFTFAPSTDHPRHHYALRCLDELLVNLGYDGELNLHIADDGSGPGHVELLEAVGRERNWGGRITTSNSERRGYGASYNAMTNVVHGFDSELVLSVEDDWALMRPFDVTPLAEAFGADPELNCIRLNYLGFGAQGIMRGRIVRHLPGRTFLMFDPACPEYHLWSAGPRIETVGFQRKLGLFREHCSAGEMEIDVAGRPASREGIAWPLDAGVNAALDFPSVFAHIGTVSVKDEPVR